MDYENKYYKYKLKYINLKKRLQGGDHHEPTEHIRRLVEECNVSLPLHDLTARIWDHYNMMNLEDDMYKMTINMGIITPTIMSLKKITRTFLSPLQQITHDGLKREINKRLVIIRGVINSFKHKSIAMGSDKNTGDWVEHLFKFLMFFKILREQIIRIGYHNLGELYITPGERSDIGHIMKDIVEKKSCEALTLTS